MELPRPSWKQALIGLAVTVVATVLAGALLSWFQTREPELAFTSPETIPYLGIDKQVAVYQTTVINKGKKSATNVTCLVEVPGGMIEEAHVVADKAAKLTEQTTHDAYRVEMSELNPSETIVLSVLASAKGSLPSQPNVSLRASGIMGKQESLGTSSGKTGLVGIFWSVLPAVVGVMAAFTFMVLRLRVKRESTPPHIKKGKHFDDQREIIAYICGQHGLIDEVDRLLSMPRQTSYWAESDRLTARALNSPQEVMTKYGAVLKDLLQYASMVELTEGIVNMNLARIAVRSGKEDEAAAHLKLAQEKMRDLFDARMKLDEELRAIRA